LRAFFLGDYKKILSDIKPNNLLNLRTNLYIINKIYNLGINDKDKIRFLVYYLSSGEKNIVTLLKFIAYPGKNYPQLGNLSLEEKKRVLETFNRIWKETKGLDQVQEDIAKQVNKIFESLSDIEATQVKDLMRTHLKNFKDLPHLKQQESLLQAKYDKVDGILTNIMAILKVSGNILVIHFIFWFLLICFYSKITWVQSLFFWNKDIRDWGGLWYVTFLLTYIPFLRRIILAPFKENFLSDANIDNFNEQLYFKDSPIQDEDNKTLVDIMFLESLKGHKVLRGESGLGKTMFLRHVLKKTNRISVFLTADKCKDGVEKAVQDKVLGIAQDSNFLNSLIYNSAIDIYIDGINEVSPETRATINAFINKYRTTNCFLTTQPIDWNIPKHVKVFDLMPLPEDKIRDYLNSRYSIYEPKDSVSISEYNKWIDNYLNKTIGNTIPKIEREGNIKILSNPFDLRIVGYLIFNKNTSLNLLSLQEEYYNQMASDYEQTHPQKGKFPLAKFSKSVYEMRCNDVVNLDYKAFYDEINCMGKHKMVIKRENKSETVWFLRHDKIRDFFLYQIFKSAKEKQTEHLSDPRFRGVYFLLATLLPLDEAKALRDILIDYAAEKKDHSVSDEFHKLLKSRIKP
jgi:hypothetical protein